MLQSARFHCILALLVAICLIPWQALDVKDDVYSGDSFTYLSVAKDLYETGRFTNGNFTPHDEYNPDGTRPSGMFFAPLYPALAALSMAVDTTVHATITCHSDAREAQQSVEGCPHDFGALKVFNIILAIIAAWLVWGLGYVTSGRLSIAWAAFALATLAEAFAYYTGQAMTENLVFPLFTAMSLTLVLACKHRQARYWVLTGILFGLLALTRPSFSYLFYAVVPVVIVTCALLKTISVRQGVLWALVLTAGYAATIAPWIARNSIQYNTPAISKGYASFILVQRVAYNDMSWAEWRASFVYGLPDFGDSLAKDLFPPESYERFAYDNPNGFYYVGNGALREETLEAAGGADNHLSYLLKSYILSDPTQHIATTLSLAWRGMWVSKYWGLVAIPIFAGVFIVALRQKWWEFVIIAIPPWFMLGFHAFTSVNVVRYNLILIPCLAIAVAFMLVRIYDRIRKNNTAKDKLA